MSLQRLLFGSNEAYNISSTQLSTSSATVHKEALGGLCHHCQALVFAALPMGHLEDFLTLLWDLIRDPTQIHIVMVYSLDTALRSS